MIPVDVLNSLKALLLTQKPLPQVAPATAVIPEFELGQKLQATVQAQLATGIFKVKVADQLMQLQLPNTVRSGDIITLQVASLMPRLTFNMAASTNPLPTADPLSPTSRLLSSLTQQPQANTFLRSLNSTPLFTGATRFPETTELAGKLQTTITQSGLFYESHQAQWLAGSRNTAQLLQEPQNMTAEQVTATWSLGEKAATAGSHATTQAVEFTKDTTKPQQFIQNQKSDQINADLNLDNKPVSANHADTPNKAAPITAAPEKISIPGIADHLQPLIQQQLNALETRQVQWQGQVWPDQEMNWKIREEASNSPGGEEGRQWATQINLDLPNLGEVTATLRFSNNGLSVTLDADKDETRSKLGTATSTLVSLLAERGISTNSALVTQHDNV